MNIFCSVEQKTLNLFVAGSIPAGGTTFDKYSLDIFIEQGCQEVEVGDGSLILI